jgi:hypothetical protein
LVTTQCEAPVTAWPPVPAAPTPDDGCSVEDELEELLELFDVGDGSTPAEADVVV